MLTNRLVLALLTGAVVLLALALADVSAVLTSVAGLAGLGAAFAAELAAARERGVAVGELPRPSGVRYLLIAFPFLVAVSAAGEEHVLAAVGAAVLTQAAYVRIWRVREAAPA